MTGTPPAAKLPALTLVVGGARSGKSQLAEGLIVATGLPRHYIATAEAWDDEMHTRIARHQAGRDGNWTTWDAPRDIEPILAVVPAGHAVLLDCATLWLTNLLMDEADIKAKITSLLKALAGCAAPVVVVSNEVGWGIVPDNALARDFRDHQGVLNQKIAAQADLVIGAMAGLPLVLKGVMPRPSFIKDGDDVSHKS